MLSYRHAFHAGNHADVLKHAVLALLLNALLRKDKPFVYIDTHAGAGRYDLDDPRALQTAEAAAGVARWWTSTAAPLQPWLEVVRALNPDGRLRWYPGSPLLAHKLLRDCDQLALLELHPTDHVALSHEFAFAPGVRIERADAYVKLKAWLPPLARRGLVFIDPSYELRGEEAQVTALLTEAHRRWATGVYALWYPILTRLASQRFIERLAGTGLRRLLQIEYLPEGEDSTAGLKGSGMLLVNPPFQIDVELEALAQILADGDSARSRVRWVVGE